MQIKLLVACHDREEALHLCAIIGEAAGEAMIVQAAEVGAALPRIEAAHPDVLLLDHSIHEEERTLRVLSALAGAGTRVLVLCHAYTYAMMIRFIQFGASGCLLRSSTPSIYAKAVRAVRAGETWFGRSELLEALRCQMVAEPAGTSIALEPQEPLTAREQEIMGFIGKALSNKEIARRLMISDQTVKTHLHHIYVKLHKSGRYKAFLLNGSPPH